MTADEQKKSFTVGQIITITGGKHAKTIDNEKTKCIITSIKSTFCEVSIFNRNDPEDPGSKIQCHRKFLSGVDEQLPPSDIKLPEAPAGGEVVAEEKEVAFEMPDAADCVAVSKTELDAINSAGATSREDPITALVQEVVNDIADDATDVALLRARVAELEGDCASYRDMMMGHQNELNYLRTQTAPTEDERKQRNETIINCINLLCRLQQ